MENIVVVRGYPLNAHFCQCLAYFSRVLEKCYKIAHNQIAALFLRNYAI